MPTASTSNKAFAGAVYVGRFQPPHAAHVGSVVQALSRAERVLVLLGSANLARSVKNPWSASERAQMLRGALREAGADPRRVSFRPLPDRFDTERWAADVRAVAAEVFGAVDMALVGFEKDDSSAYLRWFPGWSRLAVPEVPGLNATDIRRAYFTGQALPDDVPEAVRTFLAQFALTPAFARLQVEWEAVEAARAALPKGVERFEERWLHLQGEQVWLNTRQGDIGRSLWELPGHFLPAGERPKRQPDAVFDHPARSLVAPTTAYVYKAAPPSDTPAHAVALAYALAHPRRFFEDHGVILLRMLERSR